MNNKPYLLALNRIKGIGPRFILNALKKWPDLQELFETPAQQLMQHNIPEKIAAAIYRFNFSCIDDDLTWEEEKNHHIMTIEDTTYPLLLKEIHTPPAILYARGDLRAVQQKNLAIVGTRKPSHAGAETAFHFANKLSQSGLSIISGLASGIDKSAHEGAVHAKGCTVGVMATGIDQIYPRENQTLSEKIIENNGLLLTEFPRGTEPIAGHFPQRNRIISGLSLATLVIEAAIKSGSLITARLALEQNRDVFAIPGSIRNPQARGCHYLLQQGAKLITCPADILDELGIAAPRALVKQEQLALSGLATEDKKLLKCIGYEVSTVDEISNRSKRSLAEVTCSLALLELKGLVNAVPGGYICCDDENKVDV